MPIQPKQPPASQADFLRQILDINPNLIFAKDREGRFTLVNQALADIYGTTVEELTGKTDADFNPDSEQVAFFRSIDMQVMDSLEEKFIPEEVITDAKGRKHWLQTVKRPIIGQDGVANQVLGVATDITHRKLLEEQLRQAQKMEAIGQLAGGIAHDFNNMLAVVLGNTERLLSKCTERKLANASLKEGLNLILSAGERAAELVSQLLAFGRKQPIQPVVLSLCEVVTSLNDLLRQLIREDIILSVECEDRSARVRIDRAQLEQIILNLAVNARDAMPSGGHLSIRVSTVDAEMNPTPGSLESAMGRYALLTVVDTGMGISPDAMAQIFEPFFSTKKAGKGTGLGLSIVYGIVQQFGGRIAVESEPGKGSAFKVYFPIVDEPLAPVERKTTADRLDGNETIIVCEDEEDVLRLVSGILEDRGYHIIAARTTEDALRAAQVSHRPVHLLLTDVVMPVMNGRQLAAAICSFHAGIPVIFMTGYSDELLGPKKSLGTKEFLLAKPFSSTSLLQAVRSMLDKR
ncbi:MAG: PAS domain S-box protein [Planctomycetes bacterium]|nr:PAS domain S-box protein [Planctomycetota bacterium]